MLRFIFMILAIVGLFFGWKTGVLESIRSGAVPEIGKECPVEGPVKGKGVPVASSPEILVKELDTHSGFNAQDKAAAANRLKDMLASGELAMVPSKTKVRVLKNGTVYLQGVPYTTVKIKVLQGQYKDADVWIERANLIDTPIQTVVQSVRQKDDNGAEAKAETSSKK